MKKAPMFIMYLHPEVKEERWSFLHRFFHPGISEHDKKIAFVGVLLGNSHHVFLETKVRDFSEGKSKVIHIPHNLIAAMVEIPAENTQMGFSQSKEELDDLYRNIDKA